MHKNKQNLIIFLIKGVLKLLLYFLVLVIILLFALIVYSSLPVGGKSQKSSIDYFYQNEVEIYKFVNLYKNIAEKNQILDIEFNKNYSKVQRLFVGDANGTQYYYDDEISKELLNKYFSDEDLELIKKELKSLDYLSVGKFGNRISFIISRFFIGAKILNIYDESFTASELENIKKDMDCYLVKDKVIIESDQGATGGGCYF